MSSSVGKLQPPVVAFSESKGEIIGSGNYSVLVLDKREVHLYSINDFKKKAVWVYPYPTVQIVCVQDLNNSLLISLAKNTGSSIAFEVQVYSLETFRQQVVVSVPHEVTSIAPVVNFPLFSNPVCFGCQGGYVYLSDLTFDKSEKDKSISMRIVGLSSLNETNIKEILSNKQIPSIFITEKYHNNNLFEIPDSATNSSRVNYKASDIYVSSISCIVPIGAFLVGYNNGSFQLYSLASTSLIYSFKNTTNNTPVIKACYLQLADDENFGYIWIGQDNCLTLFKLQFKTSMQSEEVLKYRIDNFVRISMDYTRKLGNSKLLMCQSIRDDLIGGEDSNEDNRIYLGGYRRCLFNFASIQNTSYHLEIFDLHGLVPAIGIPNTNVTLFTPLSLSNLSLSSNILSVYLDILSMNDISLSSEESSATTLNFSILCLSNDRVQTLSFESILHKAIEWCKQQGVLLFKNPSETLANLTLLKVLHSSPEVSPLDTLLNFLFQHNLSSLVCSYIVDLVPRQSSMMLVEESLYTLKNPRSILDWSWQHFILIKETLSKEYISKIFNEPLHIEKSKFLNIIDNGLVKIVQMYHIMQTLYIRASQEGATEETIDNLIDKLSIIQLFAQYMETLQWCLDNNLFTVKYNTIFKELQSKVNKRRKYRNQAYVNSRVKLSLQNYSTECPLFIDNLFSSISFKPSGTTSTSTWEYPPKSFESIISIFLAGSPQTIDKKRDIMFYFLLDIESLAKSSIVASLDFANYFSITNSQQHLISSLWLLDASFGTQDNSQLIKSASNNLASSKSAPLPQLNFDILCAFHDLKCGFEELKYMRSISSVDIPDSLEKAAIYIQIMLNNKLIFESYDFMKKYCKTNGSAQEFLVRQLTTHCLQSNQLITLLNLPFSPEEEDVVVKTLGSFKPNGNEYLCVYYMQRSKYVDAHLLQTSSNGSIDPSLSAILTGYLDILPSVQLESTVYSRENRKHHLINEEMEDASDTNNVSEHHHHSILFPISRDTSFDSIVEDYQEQLNSTPVQSKSMSLTPYKSIIRRSASDMNGSTLGLTPKRVTFSRENADSESVLSTPQQLPNNTTISSNGSTSTNSAIRRSARLSKKFGSGDISLLPPPATKPKLSAPIIPMSSSSSTSLHIFRPKPKETTRKHQMQLRNMNALQ